MRRRRDTRRDFQSASLRALRLNDRRLIGEIVVSPGDFGEGYGSRAGSLFSRSRVTVCEGFEKRH